ncbi:MAG: hypothetical protein ACI4JI_06995 [Ruminiclostridium sp.]
MKYVPDGFLSEEQIKAKREAQKIDYNKYGRYAEVFENDKNGSENKFSLSDQTSAEYDMLTQENEELKAQVEALKNEMKLTKGHKVNPEAVQKLAKKYIKDYSRQM